METISLKQNDFAKLFENSKIISQHTVYGPKVFITSDGDYVKVFNPKSGFTKRKFYPKYKTFINNVEKLKKLGINTVTIKNIYHLEQHNSYAVRYKPISGSDLRTVCREQGQQTIRKFIPFLARLHALGIYFRGIHLGNILVLDDKQFGIIDLADLYFKRGSLSAWHRVRNIRHMLKNEFDAEIFHAFGIKNFINDYLACARMSSCQMVFFRIYCSLYKLEA